jgi:hypothetical protein
MQEAAVSVGKWNQLDFMAVLLGEREINATHEWVEASGSGQLLPNRDRIRKKLQATCKPSSSGNRLHCVFNQYP